MDKYIGKILDGRYEIIEVIGIGGMSVVYKARCNRLNRYVALKILKEEYSADELLRRQFHDESQSVAILSHPNIVSVYDVSHYEDTEYIVMELIDGITLKEYLKRRGALSWKEVTFFSIQIAKALEHAHSRNIIHRDIKPQNIMLLRDGTLKVADFGIAKNMVEQTGTKPLGEAIGSVHYVSPEQAKGSLIDARSDLYSFGVVMYEMLTGRLPFEGDTPVSVAIQHINSIALPPSDFVDSIPKTLETITMKAMNPILSKRYASARDILNDLESFISNPDFELYADDTKPEILVKAPTKSNNSAEKKQHDRNSANADDYVLVKKKMPDGTVKIVRRPVNKNTPSVDKRERPPKKTAIKNEEKIDPVSSKKRKTKKSKSNLTGFTSAVVFMLITILLALAGVTVFVFKVIDPFGSSDTNRPVVPNLIGEVYDYVIDSLEFAEYKDLIVKTESIYNDEYEAGIIIDQTPKQGKKLSKGKQIEVTVSLGKREIILDDYTGLDYKEVQNILRLQQIQTSVSSEYSSVYSAGKIIYTQPAAGQPVSKSDTVHIVYSMGPAPEQTFVPNVIGKTLSEAKTEVEKAGLIVGEPEYKEDEKPAGTVILQTIAPETFAEKGSVISFIVSTGPHGGDIPPETNVGHGVSTDPYPEDIAKRYLNYSVSIIEAEGPISVVVRVNSYTEYEGTHYYSEGSITVPLTAYFGYNTITVIQNDKTILIDNVDFN